MGSNGSASGGGVALQIVETAAGKFNPLSSYGGRPEISSYRITPRL